MTKDQKPFPDKGSTRCYRLKKTFKDKCKVIGETTMYYGNAGSVQVLSPIPGSPSSDSKPMSAYIRPDSPKGESLVRTGNKGNTGEHVPEKKTSSRKRTKDYSLPPIKNVPTMKPSKKMADKNTKEFSSTETCKPINMPGLKSRGKRNISRNKMSPTTAELSGKESTEKLIFGVRRIPPLPSKSIKLSEDRIRLPVPRGARAIPNSVKVLPQKCMNTHIKFPPLLVHSMAAL